MACISDDIIRKFYETSIFGFPKEPSILDKVSRRAYLDMCRTLRLKGKISEGETDVLYKDAAKIITDSIQKLLGTDSQEDFEKKHEECCNKLIRLYEDKNLNLHYGQAQKWINMTMKYLHILKPNGYSLSKSFQYLHVPIDQIIIKAVSAKEEDGGLGVTINGYNWSRFDKKKYNDIQKKIREKLKTKGLAPLEWEFNAWNNLKFHN